MVVFFFWDNSVGGRHTLNVTFRAARAAAAWWDPFNGDVRGVAANRSMPMHLEPYESTVVVFTDHAAPPPKLPPPAQFAPVDLAHDWKVTFDKTGATETMQSLRSWTDDEADKYYSGTASYERTVEIPDSVARAGTVFLDFGTGTPVERTTLHQAGMRAWYDPPLREAALVYVNGTRAGAVWYPPY